MTESTQRRQPVRWPWVPRSLTAVSLLLAGGVLAAGPVLLLGFITLVNASGCFIECGEPDTGAAVVTGTGALLLTALPFAAVRYYQGAASDDAQRRRLALLAVLVLLAALVEAGVFFDWM